eukprot:CAMPEP_0183575242 /NCGR_PEP_ID=MMETSP0371-20130417/135180_1 /TAXON_ID=268820 /ORGANISM="Peridinium aciculiferum, Strain PAER-2" /LENGTH=50 /DNA_ID=CAMNT_0025785381 /DNA_START=92 /DNA_END=240 /DNA_ORIENTATION=-
MAFLQLPVCLGLGQPLACSPLGASQALAWSGFPRAAWGLGAASPGTAEQR